MRLAQLSFIDIYLVILSEAKKLSAKQSYEPVTMAVTSFNFNGDYVMRKIVIWQEIGWSRQMPEHAPYRTSINGRVYMRLPWFVSDASQ